VLFDIAVTVMLGIHTLYHCRTFVTSH